MYQALSPRELSVYFYLCSLFGDSGTAYPLVAQIARDLGVSNRSVIKRAINGLVDKGFVLRKRVAVGDDQRRAERTVYQRPAIETTLLRLLDDGIIDGWLLTVADENNVAAAGEDRTSKRTRRKHESSTVKGLKNLSHLHEAVGRYQAITHPERKAEALRWILDRSLAESRRLQRPPF
jgi:DNA-binding MarR family transcriptional regulator